MDMELFRKIIDDASRLGVARVRLFLHGEPLIHPGFIDMVRYCKSKRMSVQITTNGTLMTDRRARALLGAGVDSSDHVTFSILGSTKESHERIMQRGNYDGEVRNIMGLLQRRRESGVNGPVVETIFYRMPENEGEEEAYLDTWRPIVDHARLGGRISESFAGYKKGSGPVPQRTRTCLNLWERMTVFWNGDVTICNEDVDGDWVVGNLKDESIASIWNGERLSALRKIHREKQFSKFPFCNECDM
jgi:radical SAM protein with 4Fe4S-binding SPASM domain